MGRQEGATPDREGGVIGGDKGSSAPPGHLDGREDTYFCLLLLTENNADDHSYLYSMESVFSQNYSSYRLVILDNASADRTAQLTKRHLLSLQRP